VLTGRIIGVEPPDPNPCLEAVTVLDPRSHPRAALLVLALLLPGCATVRQTDPPVTANQQLLITSAVDRAVSRLQLPLPAGSKVFFDPANVDLDGTVVYPRYAIAAVRGHLLRQGAQLTAVREEADVVVEMRTGAQSINDRKMLFGLPGLTVPVPLWGAFAIPEIPLFKLHRETGRSKLALVAYDRDGRFIADTGPIYGEAVRKHWVVLILFSHSSQDYPDD
jgi:hypothetical protein